MMDQNRPKKLLLGVTGGIAAYKVAELVRLLRQDDIELQVVMTEAACRFITPVTLQALSGNTVYTDLWDPRMASNMAHIDLSRDCDAIVIAPASADFMAKVVHGFADDLLSTLCIARECPLLVAPAMNRQMWDNPATQRNVATLIKDGVTLLGPAAGDQACGEVGMGRMLEAEDILAGIKACFAAKLLAGKNVLITAGPTFEALDPVRGITNRSSGKMGYAIARAALDAGAKVTLVSGPSNLCAPFGAAVIPVISAADMYKAVMANVSGKDIFISVAAVADYTIKQPSRSKIKKSTAPLTLELAPTVDIVSQVAQLPSAPFCVGFAAESDNLHEYAEAKRKRKKLPILAANLVQTAIGGNDNELILFDDDGVHPMGRLPKETLARELVRHIVNLMDRQALTRSRTAKKTSKDKN
ncbi:MAG: bifunctional phosphopantothenoylcysteine decarboxylase/phosphopantothenate--cysteine ligase CoaBC [Burkholderiales bacterium]